VFRVRRQEEKKRRMACCGARSRIPDYCKSLYAQAGSWKLCHRFPCPFRLLFQWAGKGHRLPSECASTVDAAREIAADLLRCQRYRRDDEFVHRHRDDGISGSCSLVHPSAAGRLSVHKAPFSDAARACGKFLLPLASLRVKAAYVISELDPLIDGNPTPRPNPRRNKLPAARLFFADVVMQFTLPLQFEGYC